MNVEKLWKIGLTLWLVWAMIVGGVIGFCIWAVYRLVMHYTGG